MQALDITSLSKTRDHHTSQHLHANLTVTDTRGCCLEQPLQGISFKEK